MNTTFRLRRTFRNQGLGFLPVFLAWFVGVVYWIGNDPKLAHRIELGALMGIVPLFMAWQATWMLLAYWREELTIQGDRLAFRGIFQRKEIDLNRVTHARWRTWPGHEGSIVLRDDSTRLVVYLSNFEPEERAAIGEFLRSALTPEIQVNWNLFAYRTERRLERLARTKPGPDEIVLRRDRWDRLLGPSLAVMGLVGIVGWRMLARPGCLALPLFPLSLWAMIRFATPAEGMIARKVTIPRQAETIRNIGFLLIWILSGLVGLATYAYLRPGMKELDPTLIAGIVVWVAVLLAESYRDTRRQAVRDREAADLAAKGRGEPIVDSWGAE